MVLVFATKRKWREDSRLEAIEAGLSWARANAVPDGIRSLALPALGCGLGILRPRSVPLLADIFTESVSTLPFTCPERRESHLSSWNRNPFWGSVTGDHVHRRKIPEARSHPPDQAAGPARAVHRAGASCTGCTPARSTASRSSSASTASTRPATTPRTSTGWSTPRPTSTTSRSSRPRRTSPATW